MGCGCGKNKTKNSSVNNKLKKFPVKHKLNSCDKRIQKRSVLLNASSKNKEPKLMTASEIQTLINIKKNKRA
jgi:hypothetical protein